MDFMNDALLSGRKFRTLNLIDDYNREKAKPNTIMVMLTGRMIKLSTHVEKILEQHGLEFDEYHYNKGGATEIAKIKNS